MRVIVFCFLLLFNIYVVQAGPRVMSLNLSGQESNPLKVFQNAPLKVNNTFHHVAGICLTGMDPRAQENNRPPVHFGLGLGVTCDS